MATTVSEDVDTLVDLLSLLPPFRGDWNGDGAWDPDVRIPRFWARFIDVTEAEKAWPSDPEGFYEGRIFYMESKLVDRSGMVDVPTTAKDATYLAAYCLQFFAVTRVKEACELLGSHFTPTFNTPDGNAEFGRRWANELVSVAWRIYRSIGELISTWSALLLDELEDEDRGE